ncbi:hypothetical protein BBBOND_0310640 [Babesia bigemina]|uniref:Uncharacterized protein n=1 Tax=Babesia bigemina TaxID=5866 RepID=A0A061D8X8_BABBI|nr:hypothetical protein BBBOND_0310640 [Babesia bigemina]CDR97161.1 hypothetical protein BBBOND_0310640 [Babesia bigemina]|eukprot:XP_012769347.1 hypothetical protein BBBOND_0310640 [Babesia bigemina]
MTGGRTWMSGAPCDKKKPCPDFTKCKCTCCKKKCAEQADKCSPPAPPAPQLPPDSSHAESDSFSQPQPFISEDHIQESNSPSNPQAIAAVIVAIIVAIILLDLCIFRFPVGRNIRDFLVRKIPFCIAFYS